MFKKLIRVVLTLAAISTGASFGKTIAEGVNISEIVNLSLNESLTEMLFIFLFGLIFGIIVFIFAPFFIDQAQRLAKYFEKEITKVPAEQVALGFLGLIAGFLVAYVVRGFVKTIPRGLVGSIL